MFVVTYRRAGYDDRRIVDIDNRHFHYDNHDDDHFHDDHFHDDHDDRIADRSPPARRHAAVDRRQERLRRDRP